MALVGGLPIAIVRRHLAPGYASPYHDEDAAQFHVALACSLMAALTRLNRLVPASLALRGRLFLVQGCTIRHGKIVEIDQVADPTHLRQLRLTQSQIVMDHCGLKGDFVIIWIGCSQVQQEGSYFLELGLILLASGEVRASSASSASLSL